MLTKIITGLVVLAIVVVLLLVGLSIYSRNAPPLRAVDGGLRPCPDSPNCVNSEFSGLASSIAPFTYSGPARQAWDSLSRIVREAGGEIIQEDPGYLRATFTTPLFRFVDELELRLEPRYQLIHVRSASRVGYSDRGVNRERVEMLRQRFEASQSD